MVWPIVQRTVQPNEDCLKPSEGWKALPTGNY